MRRRRRRISWSVGSNGSVLAAEVLDEQRNPTNFGIILQRVMSLSTIL